VVGASGRSGAALCRALAARGTPFVPVVRDPARWHAAGIASAPPRLADITDPPALARALHDAVRVASGAHARHADAILHAAPAARRLVVLGSTRKFTRWPDAHGQGVLAGERAILASGRPATILHPTMIYGAQGENNVARLAALLRRLPIVPLPGGGRALVQPIHQSDVTACLLAALDEPEPDRPAALVIAGPDPLPYADFVRAVAHAYGLRPPRIIPVPASALTLAAPLTRLLPMLPTIGADEVRRLGEDKAFDIQPMRRRLGVEPITLARGLAMTASPGVV
jgi:uncharacterized protein YbjT (DUF2867 family)